MVIFHSYVSLPEGMGLGHVEQWLGKFECPDPGDQAVQEPISQTVGPPGPTPHLVTPFVTIFKIAGSSGFTCL